MDFPGQPCLGLVQPKAKGESTACGRTGRHPLGQARLRPGHMGTSQRIPKTNHALFLSHFIDEKTETQRKGLRDLPMTLEPGEAEAGLVCRFPGPLRSVLFEKSPEDLGRNGPLLLRSKVEVGGPSPAFQQPGMKESYPRSGAIPKVTFMPFKPYPPEQRD